MLSKVVVFQLLFLSLSLFTLYFTIPKYVDK